MRQKNLVKYLKNVFEKSEKIILEDDHDSSLRPLAVRLLMRRNRNLFMKGLIKKGKRVLGTMFLVYFERIFTVRQSIKFLAS